MGTGVARPCLALFARQSGVFDGAVDNLKRQKSAADNQFTRLNSSAFRVIAYASRSRPTSTEMQRTIRIAHSFWA
jgi:hypothetical protein